MSRSLFRTEPPPIRPRPRARVRNRIAAAVAMLELLLMTIPTEARTMYPIEGGSGDAGFQDRCPAGQYLIGLAGRGGSWVDRVQIICAPVLPNGTQGTSWYGTPHGGSGGAAFEFSCLSDSFVTGTTIYLSQDDKRVQAVHLVCNSMQGTHPSALDAGGGVPFGEQLIPNVEPCPSDELATGLAGRYGKDVNAMGLICDARPGVGAPAPVATPYPVRQTGKLLPTSALSCPSGYVWREASPADHVCVDPEQRRLTAAENSAGQSHISATDRTYGPNTCVQGYVWRQAFAGDAVCVTPQQRAAAAEQNGAAPPLVPASPSS